METKRKENKAFMVGNDSPRYLARVEREAIKERLAARKEKSNQAMKAMLNELKALKRI